MGPDLSGQCDVPHHARPILPIQERPLEVETHPGVACTQEGLGVCRGGRVTGLHPHTYTETIER